VRGRGIRFFKQIRQVTPAYGVCFAVLAHFSKEEKLHQGYPNSSKWQKCITSDWIHKKLNHILLRENSLLDEINSC